MKGAAYCCCGAGVYTPAPYGALNVSRGCAAAGASDPWKGTLPKPAPSAGGKPLFPNPGVNACGVEQEHHISFRKGLAQRSKSCRPSAQSARNRLHSQHLRSGLGRQPY